MRISRSPLSVGFADTSPRKRGEGKRTADTALTSPRLRGEVARRAGEGTVA